MIKRLKTVRLVTGMQQADCLYVTKFGYRERKV